MVELDARVVQPPIATLYSELVALRATQGEAYRQLSVKATGWQSQLHRAMQTIKGQREHIKNLERARARYKAKAGHHHAGLVNLRKALLELGYSVNQIHEAECEGYAL